jgi:nitrite reductase/ring-hydroxylating ferredoxin subunit
MRAVVIAPESAVVEGRIHAVDVDGRALALCRIEGRVCAVQNSCSHEDWPLTDGYVVDGHVVCSLHGAAFDAASGACTRGPADAPLETFPVETRDGHVVLLVPE